LGHNPGLDKVPRHSDRCQETLDPHTYVHGKSQISSLTIISLFVFLAIGLVLFSKPMRSKGQNSTFASESEHRIDASFCFRLCG
jgi:hypothetical protein